MTDTATPATTAGEATTTQIYRIYIKAAAEQVWEAIVSPDFSEKYYYGTRVDFDLRPGGAYQAVPGPGMRAGLEAMGIELPGAAVEGVVIEADPPRKLVHTFKLLMDPTVEAEGFTQVTWELTDSSPGVTRVTVTHDVTGAPATAHMVHGGDGDVEGGGGWDEILSGLKTVLETGEMLQTP